MALLLFAVVFAVMVFHHKYRYKTTRSVSPPSDSLTVDNWSIPRPQPRVWQTSATMMSSERRRNRRHHRDQDSTADDDQLELRPRSNGSSVQLLHRTPNGGLSSLGLDGLIASPVEAGRSLEASALSLQQEIGVLQTPRLRRCVLSDSMLVGNVEAVSPSQPTRESEEVSSAHPVRCRTEPRPKTILMF